MNLLLAWLYWNPNRELFRIPFIGHPIGWYGICFVLGFFLGFFLVIPMFKRKLLERKGLLERDIADWQLLSDLFKTCTPDDEVGQIFSKLDKDTQQALLDLKDTTPSDQLKHAILSAFEGHERKRLEALFPKALHKTHELSLFLADRLTWFVVAGTVIGARLGHVFFYEWSRYQNNWIDILKVWEGGLASHGGTLGVMLALALFVRSIKNRFPEIRLITLFDILAVPSALVAFGIRIGNFFNQEILGTETSVPWAIIFGTPADGSIPVPRHPVQLYEGFAYFAIFCLLFFLWKFKPKLRPGMLIGLLFTLVFAARFVLEFFKETQHSTLIADSSIQMGQYLSIPFIIVGIALCFFYPRKLISESSRYLS